MNKTTLSKPLTQAFCLLYLAGASHAVNAQDNDAAVKALLTQAGYWHSKAHDDLAMDALQKVLAVDKNNLDAMQLMALYQLQRGDTRQAEIWRKRISEISPQDPRLESLNDAQTLRSLSPWQLNNARELEQRGRTKEAIAAYRTLFNNNRPPEDLALEYYQTLAGDAATWPEAVTALRQRTTMLPADGATRLALATVLTYQPTTRREGIEQLTALATDDKQADKALQQALLWLEPKPSDLEVYSQYAQRHPEDGEPMDHYRKSIEGNATKTGFDALNNGELSQAKDAFTGVLKTQPQNGNALSGLGYVAMRQGNFTEAENLLRQAAQQGDEQNRSQWLKDADNAHFYGALNQSRVLSQEGEHTQALALLEGANAVNAEQRLAADMLRADVLRRQGRLADAEQFYRQLQLQLPQNNDIRTGLLWVLKQQNKTEEADQLLATLPPALRLRYAQAGNNGDTERKEAQAALQAGNSVKALQVLQSAVSKYPQNTWLHVDYARLLRKGGESQRAATQIASLVQRTPARGEALYAAALYFVEENDWNRAQSLLAQIPAPQVNAEIRTLKDRAQLNRQLEISQRYLQQDNRAAALNSLRVLAITPPSAPVEAGRLAQLLMQAGDTTRALQVVRTNQAQGLHGSVGDYARHIMVLNQVGLFREAESLMNAPALQNASSQQEIDNLRTGNLITRADKLREAGNVDGAWNTLMPALNAAPTNTDLLLAVARIYQADHMEDKAAEIYRYVLRKSPRNSQALTGLVNLALARSDGEEAKRAFSLLESSQDPDYLLLSARVATANGERQRAMALLRSARWRLQESSADLDNTSDVLDLVLIPPSARPSPQQLTLNNIDQMMLGLRDNTATWTGGTIALRSRNGEEGLSKLEEAKAPLIFSSALNDSTRLNVEVAPVTLNAGEMAGESANRFGSGALIHAQRKASTETTTTTNADAQGGQQSSGVQASLSLSGDSYKLDVGSTPTGGEFTRLVGGVQWMPRVSEHGSLDLKAERRAVTDSLLSYVGAKDKDTGESWGAVTRNGASAQYAWDNDLVGLYARLGFDTYIGENVPTNHAVNATVGNYVRPYKTADSELKMGMNINYMNFEKNLSYFTLGQGGYFSPQNYVALSIPVSFTRHVDDWDLTLSSSLGYQSYKKQQSDYFPGHSSLQSQLESYASADSDTDSTYASGSKSGLSYALGVDARYNLGRDMTLGMNLGYDTFGSYNEGKALFYLKYYLNNDKRSMK